MKKQISILVLTAVFGLSFLPAMNPAKAQTGYTNAQDFQDMKEARESKNLNKQIPPAKSESGEGILKRLGGFFSSIFGKKTEEPAVQTANPDVSVQDGGVKPTDAAAPPAPPSPKKRDGSGQDLSDRYMKL